MLHVRIRHARMTRTRASSTHPRSLPVIPHACGGGGSGGGGGGGGGGGSSAGSAGAGSTGGLGGGAGAGAGGGPLPRGGPGAPPRAPLSNDGPLFFCLGF